ncbi:unnamed protein product [Pylaiella littoralis]
MLAAEKGYLRVVRVLLRHGAGVSVPNSLGQTALHFSVGHGHLAVSKALIKAGADLESGLDRSMSAGVSDGEHASPEHTPLHVASEKGFHALMLLLIGAGANVDSVRGCSDSPLYLAAESGSLEAVRILLRADANPLVIGGRCLLTGAVLGGNLSVVRELVNLLGLDGCTRDNGAKALETASASSDAEMVAFLCDNGACDTDGHALCAAVQSRGEACIKLLLRRQGGNATTSTRTYANLAHRVYVLDDGRFARENSLVCTFGLPRYYSTRVARLLIDAGVDPSTEVEFWCDADDDTILRGTPLVVATQLLEDYEDAPRTYQDGLKGISRLLHQVDAVRALSWRWPNFGQAGKKRRPTSVARMLPVLPVLKRRATTPARVLLSALTR